MSIASRVGFFVVLGLLSAAIVPADEFPDCDPGEKACQTGLNEYTCIPFDEPCGANVDCSYLGKTFSEGSVVHQGDGLLQCREGRWTTKPVSVHQTGMTPAEAGGSCIFYGGIQGNQLILVNRCNECRVGTIRWTKFSGGSVIRSYSVAKLSQRPVFMVGESSSLIADNPCAIDLPEEREGRQDRMAICTRAICKGCLSTPLCEGKRVGGTCRLHNQDGTCVRLELCPAGQACCGCELGDRIFTGDGRILSLDGELLGEELVDPDVRPEGANEK